MIRRVSLLIALMIATCLMVTACGGDMLASTERAKEDAAQDSSVAAAQQQDSSAAATAASALPAEIAQDQVAVVFDTSNAHAYNDKFPATLGSFVVPFEQGDTVFDALEKTGVEFESRGRDYVSSIGGIAEKACGPNSGWLYLVDGVQPTKTASDYELAGGETVLWAYTVTEGDVTGSSAMPTEGDTATEEAQAA